MTTKTYLPDFYQLYEIAADADERSLKKVYARELKKIDQASQAPQFQQLREHYEQALNWLKWQSDEPQQVEGDTASLSSTPITPVSEQVRTDAATSTQSKAEFASNSNDTTQNSTAETATPEAFEHTTLAPQQLAKRALTQLYELVERADCQREQLQQLFQETMQDQAMSHIDTRSYFEEGLLDYLNEGWLAHKHWLFELAVGEFDWSVDDHKFAYHNHEFSIAVAYKEFKVYQKSWSTIKGQYEHILQLAREKITPSDNSLLVHSQLLWDLTNKYTNILWYLTDFRLIQVWQERSAFLCQQAQSTPEIRVTKKSSKIYMALFFLLAIVTATLSISKKYSEYKLKASNLEKHNRSSYLERGDNFYYGRVGIPANVDSAIANWKQAATGGSSKAAFKLAQVYEIHRKNLGLALHWYEQAAWLGNHDANRISGDFYFYGRLGSKDFDKAEYWYKRCDLANCDMMLFKLYSEKSSDKADQRLALEALQKAATANLDIAMHKLAIVYLYGELGQKKEYKRGLELLEKSAKSNEISMDFLGDIYLHGYFQSTISREQAAFWYKKASNLHHDVSKRKLDALCSNTQISYCY